MTEPIATGNCQCQSICYEILAEPIGTWACYCTECRKVGAGSFTLTIGLYRAQFRLTRGALQQWERVSDAGVRNIANFCPTCGNRIYHEDPDHLELLRLKTGTIDGGLELTPDAHLWTQRAPNWISIPEGSLAYETQPKAEELLGELLRIRGGT